MSDVVDRLRMWGFYEAQERGPREPTALQLEAADEIVALRAKLARIDKFLQTCRTICRDQNTNGRDIDWSLASVISTLERCLEGGEGWS